MFEFLKPDVLIITNLFRDQLDRYGEIDITLDYLSRAVSMCGDVSLVLNADDPLVTAFGQKTKKKCYYFGVGQDMGISLNETKEGRFCMFCGAELKYEYYHYSQLGKYACENCGFKRPEVDFEAVNVNLDNGMEFDVANTHIKVKYRGFYNIYNILAALSATKILNLSIPDYNGILSDYRPQIGRMQEFNINKKQVIFNLSKNPAGFNQAISTVLCDKRRKNIVTVINDNAQDGKDISWIWDVDFERLKDANAGTFYASGIRHNDVLVRFKYAEINNVIDAGEVRDAISKALLNDGEVLYVLVNYTALFSTENILKDLEAKSNGN